MSKLNWILILTLIALGLVIWYTKQSVPKLQQENLLIVGTNAEFTPFTFKENDEIVGFDIDVIHEVANRIGKKVELRNMPFDALIPEIQLGNIHVIAAGMTPTEERAKRVLFTKPFFAGDPLIIVSMDEKPIKTKNELTGKTVVVNEGYTADYYVSGLEGVNIQRLSTSMINEGIMALTSGRADAYVAARAPLQPYFKKFGARKFELEEIPETEETDAIAVSKKHSKLLPSIQAALDAMEEDGTLKMIKEKWNLQ